MHVCPSGMTTTLVIDAFPSCPPLFYTDVEVDVDVGAGACSGRAAGSWVAWGAAALLGIASCMTFGQEERRVVRLALPLFALLAVDGLVIELDDAALAEEMRGGRWDSASAHTYCIKMRGLSLHFSYIYVQKY
jgi:hypothetical protein